MKRFLEGGSSGSDRNAAAPTGEAAPTPRVGTEGDSHKLSPPVSLADCAVVLYHGP